MEMMNFVIVTLVLKMKEIAILKMNVKATTFVDQIIVQLHLVLPLKLIVVQKMFVKLLIGKVMAIVMMKIIRKVVYGMEETAVEVMSTHNFVQLVNALIQI